MASLAGLGTPLQEQHFTAEPPGKVPTQHGAELGVLGEQQRPLADRQHLIENFVQSFQLARAPGQPAAVAEEVPEVVAHLLGLVIVARTSPRRSIPSAARMRSSMSSTTA